MGADTWGQHRGRKWGVLADVTLVTYLDSFRFNACFQPRQAAGLGGCCAEVLGC